MAVMTPDRVLRLRDGRILGYCEYGDPAGRPLMFFHGLPGSRLSGALFDEPARERGIRVLAVDRPGFGLSDFQPSRRLTGWPTDVAELADALDLERFAVVGVSGGGPYAAVCAWAMPERVSGAGVVSGVGPFQQPDAEEGMGQGNRVLFGMARRAPFLVGLPIRFMAVVVRRSPGKALRRMAKSLPAADRAVLENKDTLRLFKRDLGEAFRGGTAGAVHETRLVVKPWGFPIEGIRVPVHLWQGLDDENVPPSMGRYQARVIPDCQAEFIPGAGHLWVFEHAGVVLDALFPPKTG
jgi:pimeloyl-ACP methyl ester carboxylesterase